MDNEFRMCIILGELLIGFFLFYSGVFKGVMELFDIMGFKFFNFYIVLCFCIWFICIFYCILLIFILY